MSEETRQPNMIEVITALRAYEPVPKKDPLATNVIYAVMALVLGMGGWALSTLGSMPATLATMQASINQLLDDRKTEQASIEMLKAGQTTVTVKIDQQGMRFDRLNDRVRVLEGQQPVNADPVRDSAR